ncbi:MAG TPA: signal peptidase I [Clostridia bacterium]|nr:signal peptidase I [Clostridia bacterium]
MRKIKIKNVLLNAFVIITLILTVFVGTMIATQTKAFGVASDSMYPVLKTGDAVFVKPVEIDKIQKYDIVTIEYNDSSGYFTHRVVNVDEEKGLIYTKGDANEKDDLYPSDASKLVGKLWFSVPYIGFISINLSQSTVLIIIASAIAVAVMATSVASKIKSIKKRGGSYEE